MANRRTLDRQWNDFICGDAPAPKVTVPAPVREKGTTRAERRASLLTEEERQERKIAAEAFAARQARAMEILAEINERMEQERLAALNEDCAVPA